MVLSFATKERLRRWLSPDVIARANAVFRRGIRFEGDFANWVEAAARAEGYEAEAILDQAIEAAEAVRCGRAAWERDGVVYEHPSPPFPLLAGLMYAAACAGGRLAVLDFGGSLGSSFFQVRPWLQGLTEPLWTVIEQPQFVQAGRAKFENSQLHFATTIGEAAARAAPNVAVLSSVLQYLPEPAEVLTELADTGVQTIIIDRTPVIEGKRPIITVQHVPSQIVRSSYPAHLFTRADLLAPLASRFSILAEFDAVGEVIYSLGRRVSFAGMVLTKD